MAGLHGVSCENGINRSIDFLFLTHVFGLGATSKCGEDKLDISKTILKDDIVSGPRVIRRRARRVLGFVWDTFASKPLACATY